MLFSEIQGGFFVPSIHPIRPKFIVSVKWPINDVTKLMLTCAKTLKCYFNTWWYWGQLLCGTRQNSEEKENKREKGLKLSFFSLNWFLCTITHQLNFQVIFQTVISILTIVSKVKPKCKRLFCPCCQFYNNLICYSYHVNGKW